MDSQSPGNAPIHLPNNILRALRTCLAEHPCIETALLYGSRARGDHRRSSDIDLALIGPQIQLRDLYRLMDALDDLLLPYTFDLTHLDTLRNDDLKREIDTQGIVIYTRNSAD